MSHCPDSPTIRSHGPTLRPPPIPHFPPTPASPSSTHPFYPRMYAADKVGGLAKSKSGSTIPPDKRHSHCFPWRSIANVSVLVGGVDTGVAVYIYFLSRVDVYRDEKRNDAFLFSFVLTPYVSQDESLFSFKFQNQSMRQHRRKYKCFWMSLRWMGGPVSCCPIAFRFLPFVVSFFSFLFLFVSI